MPKSNASLLLLVLLSVSFAQQPKTSSGSVKPKPERRYEERNYYYDGVHWVPTWFQCDGSDEVVLLLKPEQSVTQSLLTFPKNQPQERRTNELRRRGEPDCGMMNCWWNFRAVEQPLDYFAIRESHYYDVQNGFWTYRHWVGVGRNLTAAQNRQRQCRWFPRIRLAAMTDQRSLYITQDSLRRFRLKAFDYGSKGNSPSLTLTNGVITADKMNGLETYRFQQKTREYIITASTDARRPQIRIQRTEGGAISEENCLSYTYVTRR